MDQRGMSVEGKEQNWGQSATAEGQGRGSGDSSARSSQIQPRNHRGAKTRACGTGPCVSTLPACLQSWAADFEQELQQTGEKSNVNDLFYLNYHQERSQQICKYLLTKVIKD